MKSWRKIIAITFLICCTVATVPARAIDPATMSTAAPQALELAALWSPHAISAMQSGGQGLVLIGKSLVRIFYLPLGVGQCTLGLPFGYAGQGIDNCMTGLAAPFELVFHVLMLPVRILSLGTVR